MAEGVELGESKAEEIMGIRVIRGKASRALGKSNLPGVDYTLNPYAGCSHGCVYCYARLYSPREVSENWGDAVIVKENIAEVLEREVGKKRKGTVTLSTITDAYQPLEKKFGITRRLIKILLRSGFRVSIQTKSSLVLRDLDLFEKYREKADIGFTITTLDWGIARKIEKFASPPEKRVEALREVHSSGIKTWIFLGPIIPGSDEEDLKEIVKVAKETGSNLYYDKFRVKVFMKSGIEAELAEQARKTDWSEVTLKIEDLCERLGVKAVPAFGKFRV